jgi:hypothetical protein
MCSFVAKFVLLLPDREYPRGRLPETLDGIEPAQEQRQQAPQMVADMGFDIPTHDWFRGTLRPLLMDTLTAEAIEASGVFDARAIQTMIRDHMERRMMATSRFSLVSVARYTAPMPPSPGLPVMR